jgi:HEAT repeat protein
MGLAEAIAQLSSSDECERIYAAEDIGLAGQIEGVDPLCQRLVEEPSQAVREAIFAALALIPDNLVIERAAQLLSNDDPGIRNQALELLQSRGGAVVPELRCLLTSDSHHLRKFAVDVLSRIEIPESEELLQIALADSDINVIITALENVRHCHSPVLLHSVLQHALYGDHSMLVMAALEALGRIGDAECYSKIREKFPTLETTPSLYLRPALKLLSAYGANGDLMELQGFLTTCEPALRAAVLDALHSLLRRNGAAGIPEMWWQGLLSSLPGTTEAAERYQTLVLLGHCGQCAKVFEALISYLQSPESVDRLGAIEALRNNGFDDARNVMQSRLRLEHDPEVKQALEDALGVNGQ